MSTRLNRSVRSLVAVALLAVLASAPHAARAQTSAPATAPAAPAAPAADNSPAPPVVPAKTIRVQVLGAVERPGNIEVNDGDRLSVALTRAGVDKVLKPDLSRVFLLRSDPATGKSLPSYMIDVYQALRQGDQRYDPILRAGDKIYVPEARPSIGVPIQIATTPCFVVHACALVARDPNS